jgi:1,4-dihydroxy-2-naphthoate octaprenyltransferase
VSAMAERTTAGSAPPALRKSPLRIWLSAARPRTLSASAVPVAVGSAVAALEGSFRPLPALAALVCSLLIQVATNLVNDYADHRRGADTADRMGPPRASAQGWLAPAVVLRGAWLCFGLATVLGAYLVAVGGWPIFVVGLASLLAGWAYTAGPYPLAYHGLGDLFVFCFFGLVSVLGTVWVQAGRLSWLAWGVAVPIGAVATALLVVNNLRDIPTDARVGKRTLAVRMGVRWTRVQYLGLIVVLFAAPPLLVLRFGAPVTVLWAMLAAPLAVEPLRRVMRREGAALNVALAGTARLQWAYGALMSVGLLTGR